MPKRLKLYTDFLPKQQTSSTDRLELLEYLSCERTLPQQKLNRETAMKAIRSALRHALRCAAVGSGLALVSVVSHAQGAQAREIALDIKPQSMSDALSDWARQTGLQVIYPDVDITNRLVAPPVIGTYTAQAALNQLLAGTELTYEFVNERTVSVRDRHPSAPMRAKPMGRKQNAEYVRLVDRQFGGEASEEANEDVKIRAGAIEESKESASDEITRDKKKRADAVEEVFVTGTHIRGIENSTAPLIVLDRDAIDRTGYSTTQELFRFLPQNFSGGQSGATEDGLFGSGTSVGANFTSASGINLRGLGTSSTLVLLNGHRMAPSVYGSFVDVSLIPLAAIDRVEILPDGSSALYGSDAVGGVVNIILKNQYEGADTSLTYGRVSNGGRTEGTVAQTLGTSWSSGNVVAALQYQDQQQLRAQDRAFTQALTRPNDLFPDVTSYGVSLSGKQQFSDRLEGHGDVLWSKRHIERNGSGLNQVRFTRAEPEIISVAPGLRYRLSGDWSVDLGALYSREHSESSLHVRDPIGSRTSTNDATFSEKSADLLLSGKWLQTGAGKVGMAVGASYRDEDPRLHTVLLTGMSTNTNAKRSVKSAYGEMYIPLIGDANHRPLLWKLDFSTAVRYDDYSDFGSTTNPRVGVRWAPSKGLSIRAAYSESFRAPNPSETVGEATSLLFTFPLVSPMGGVVPAFVQSGSAKLGPERARTFNFSADYDPEWIEGLSVGINYYDVQFEDRIIIPSLDANVLNQPAVYGQLISRLADDAAAQAFLDSAIAEGANYIDLLGTGAGGVRNVVDFRQQNASIVRQSGIDVTSAYRMTFSSHAFTVRLNASFIDHIETAFAQGATATDLVDTFGNPTEWRLRADTTLSGTGWVLNSGINYVSSYVNTSSVNRSSIASWTTFDLLGRLDADSYFNSQHWKGISFTLSILNLFDRDPPFVSAPTATAVNYDPANATPLGRFVSIGFRKTW